MSIVIRVLNGVTAGREFLLEREVFVCGRDSTSDFVIEDRDISGRHCRFVSAADGSQHRLEDLNSSNGTFVNNTLIQSKVLAVGDRIQIGNTLLELATTGEVSDNSLHAVDGEQTADVIEYLARTQAVAASDPKDTTKQLVWAVSHRINNYLQLNSGGEFLIDAGLEANDLEQIAQGWSIVRRTQNRINQLSVNLSTYCRDFKPLLRKLNLHDLISLATSEIGNSFNETRIKIVHRTAADFTVKLDERFSSRAIESVLCVGLMASVAGDGEQNEVTLETSLSDESVLIRVGFRHFDDRFDLAQLIEAKGVVDKIKGELGMLELLVSRKIIEGQAGTITCVSEDENLNWIEVRFPVG